MITEDQKDNLYRQVCHLEGMIQTLKNHDKEIFEDWYGTKMWSDMLISIANDGKNQCNKVSKTIEKL